MSSLRKYVNGLLLILATQFAWAQDAEHQKAAADLYALLGGNKMAEAGAEAMMPMVRSNPQLAPYEDVFRAWYKKVLDTGALQKQIVELYAGTFAVTELRGLIDFYKTPLGAKALEKLPGLMQRASRIGESVAMDNLDDLEAMLSEARKARGDTSQPPAKQ